VESRFFEPPRETKIGSKNQRVREIGVKLQCSTEERETTFGSSYREVRKNEGSKKRDSHCIYFFFFQEGTVTNMYFFFLRGHGNES